VGFKVDVQIFSETCQGFLDNPSRVRTQMQFANRGSGDPRREDLDDLCYGEIFDSQDRVDDLEASEPRL
jgi:hypothetical protein